VIAPSDLSSLDPTAKDSLILALFERVTVLLAEVEHLKAENAALRHRVSDLEEKVGLRPKMPDLYLISVITCRPADHTE